MPYPSSVRQVRRHPHEERDPTLPLLLSPEQRRQGLQCQRNLGRSEFHCIGDIENDAAAIADLGQTAGAVGAVPDMLGRD